MAGVVDEQGNWSGGVDFFVQTGDIIDRSVNACAYTRPFRSSCVRACRGDDTIKLYVWMDKLRGQAQAAGGQVLSHLGNHEWMNAIGDWRYAAVSMISCLRV